MKRVSVVLATLGILGLSSSSAWALSCVEPEPIDWERRYPAVQAAVIGVVESVERADTQDHPGGLSIRVRVVEILKGRAPAILEYPAASLDPWGPFYEIGQEVAIVIENGEVTDGQMNICGPWFSPDELRQAAADHGPESDAAPTAYDRLISVLSSILRLLLGW